MHAIAARLTPSSAEEVKGAGFMGHLEDKGIVKLRTTNFTLYCYQSYTGLKFIVAADNTVVGAKEKLKSVYEKYSDYVCKNAYQQIGMPIRSLLFDQEIDKVFKGSS
eukprot:TRINITY_DN3221_c0_g2_i1.p1 TRINITY_DN3221_c0_g2~~TRINITY_DN3221_c0_g2_i1.p1  ORF type:complete len:107 (+),score=27.80 TRINITY_DN3221_c0_g2_i1:186-506(+)